MKKTIKSPFFVVQDFTSPQICEDIVYELAFTTPDEDADGDYVKGSKHNEISEDLIFERIQPLIPKLESHYNISYKGTERPFFEWYPKGTSENVHCENSKYLRKQWLRINNRDLTCILFLSDYQDQSPFDDDFEVYGGKLEFPQHQFGFNPRRGTLITFPSDAHFLNATTTIEYGNLFQARFHISAMAPYIYQPDIFPGDYTSWFKDIV